MIEDMKYNGWTNYETWCANLWLTNDSGGCDRLAEDANECVDRAIDKDESDIRDAATDALADMLEAQFDDYAEEWMPDQVSFFADMLNAGLRAVNWHEIARHAIDDIALYSAGWNMPGCMPDGAPAVFTDAESALAYVQESAINAIADGEDLPSAHAEAQADSVNSWKADKNGEFGCTVGVYHYFVSIL